MNLQKSMAAVLSAATNFSTTSTPVMERRDQALARFRSELLTRLGTSATPEDVFVKSLDVRQGGRQSNYSPTAWVRVYDRRFAPTATEGFYLVYLFASDGSRAYLSLNQGTSEFRSGAMRPIRDRAELRNRARLARLSLAAADLLPPLAGAADHIDLAADSVDGLGPESRQRTRNYEDANIYALEYDAAALPSDDVVIEDLLSFIPLLEDLCVGSASSMAAGDAVADGHPSLLGGQVQGVAASGRHESRRSRQGRAIDPIERRCIEVHAEDLAVVHLADLGWIAERVGHLKRGYDLECRQGTHELHVEVKGTRTRGAEVILTRNEVNHLPSRGGHCAAGHDLIVVSEIELTRSAEGPSCIGGRINHVVDWTPSDTDLVPTEYLCRVQT